MKHNRFLQCIAAFVLAFSFANNANAFQEQPSRTDELDKLIADFKLARESFQLLSQEARRKEPSPYQTYPVKFFDFAQREYDTASLQACKILLRYPVANNRRPVVELVFKHHLEKPGIGDFLHDLIHSCDDWLVVDQFLEQAIHSDNPRTQVYGNYGKARLMISRRDWCLRGDTERYADFDEEKVASFQSEDNRKLIALLLRDVVANAADLPYREGRLADWAQQDLFAVNLEIGLPAPDVGGRDSRGYSFQLVDYRGKVVVVTFWASWCGVCMADLPAEIEFVKAMKNRPMVWLGVNGDADEGVFRKLVSEKKINFRSWYDGSQGPIANRFGVRRWPTMYVIDQDGIIRYRSRITVDLEKAKSEIQSLVADAEKNAAKNGSNQ